MLNTSIVTCMIGQIYITGVIGEDVTLLDVIKQVKAQKESTEFLVKIDSVGGYVDAGYDIYNFLKNLNQPVTTFATKAYSIASVIFMAGNNRIVAQDAEQVLMIHLPWMEIQGNHQVISEHLSELKKAEDNLIKFYSQAIEIDNTTIHSLLKDETYLNATQCIELGFATELKVAQKAVAKLHNNNNENKQSLMNKIEQKLESIMNLLTGKIKAELILQDATGVELVFPDLESTEVPTVESVVTIDNKPAEGEFVMPDGSTMIIEKGILKIIETPEEETIEEEVAPAEEAPVALEEVETVAEEVVNVEMEKLLETIEMLAKRNSELETKFTALAKQVGSDFSTEKQKENKTNVKAQTTGMSRAEQILKS